MTSGRDMAEGFDLCVMRLCAAVAANGAGATSEDLATIQAVLTQGVNAAFQSFGRDEAAEVADEAIVRFVVAIQEGRVDLEQRPAGYLTRIARNLAVDLARRPSTEPLGEWDAAEDDRSLPIIESLSHREDVRAAIRRAREAGDHSVTRVIVAWRVLHEESGRAPTSREVAMRADLSHTAVLNVLRRARAYFKDSP